MAQRNAVLHLKIRMPTLSNDEPATLDFEDAFNNHWEHIHRVLFYITGDADVAEDLALETFTRLWQKPPSNLSSLGGWLYRVATRLGYNALRSTRRHIQHEEKSAYMDPDLNEKNPIEWAVHREEQRSYVRRALQKLPDRQSQALILRYSGLSYQEIAVILQIAPGSVGKLLIRAEKGFLKYYEHFE